MTVDQAVALDDPADCLKPGTTQGRIAPNRTCPCFRHLAIRRASQRERDRRRGRGDRMPTTLGATWQLGVNALDAAPLLRRLDARGLIVEKAVADLPEDYPFPEHAKLIRNVTNRGWLTLHEADLLCIRVLGIHPFHVFGQAWDDLETGEPL